MSPVTEIVVFRLKAEADPNAFQQAAAQISILLASYQGYIDRELSVTDDGTWIDMVHWADMNSAQTAADQIMSDPQGQAFMNYLDGQSVNMYHALPKLRTP
jgi:hypothetical protein